MVFNRQADEAQEVRTYCDHHPLSRPEMAWGKWLSGAVCGCAVWTLGTYALHRFAGMKWLSATDVALFSLLVLTGKSVARVLIKIYQRYAGESLRRQCNCMPSCSEYALLALEKYSLPRALWLIWRRLTVTCASPGYHKDYP